MKKCCLCTRDAMPDRMVCDVCDRLYKQLRREPGSLPHAIANLDARGGTEDAE